MTQLEAERLRVDDLAQRTGIASGTIRFYQREGLIAAPEREGRVAYYSPAHIDRLERIRALQAQGLPLALVRDLLEREDEGEDIGGWLALDTAVFGRPPEIERVDADTLSGLGLEGPDVAALEAAGVLRRDDDGLFEALPGIMRLIAQLVAAGVPPETISAGAGRISQRLAEVAGTMAELGWEAFRVEQERIEESDQSVAGETIEKFERLRSLARQVVLNQFSAQLDEAIGAQVTEFAEQTAARRSIAREEG